MTMTATRTSMMESEKNKDLKSTEKRDEIMIVQNGKG